MKRIFLFLIVIFSFAIELKGAVLVVNNACDTIYTQKGEVLLVHIKRSLGPGLKYASCENSDGPTQRMQLKDVKWIGYAEPTDSLEMVKYEHPLDKIANNIVISSLLANVFAVVGLSLSNMALPVVVFGTLLFLSIMFTLFGASRISALGSKLRDSRFRRYILRKSNRGLLLLLLLPISLLLTYSAKK
ncbi:MAG: hypothetical protein JNJ57_07800 [Saprospiraceae bacterium]|nr:hypothetical protein [Saprospiraceae bacterium]